MKIKSLYFIFALFYFTIAGELTWFPIQKINSFGNKSIKAIEQSNTGTFYFAYSNSLLYIMKKDSTHFDSLALPFMVPLVNLRTYFSQDDKKVIIFNPSTHQILVLKSIIEPPYFSIIQTISGLEKNSSLAPNMITMSDLYLYSPFGIYYSTIESDTFSKFEKIRTFSVPMGEILNWRTSIAFDNFSKKAYYVLPENDNYTLYAVFQKTITPISTTLPTSLNINTIQPAQSPRTINQTGVFFSNNNSVFAGFVMNFMYKDSFFAIPETIHDSKVLLKPLPLHNLGGFDKIIIGIANQKIYSYSNSKPIVTPQIPQKHQLLSISSAFRSNWQIRCLIGTNLGLFLLDGEKKSNEIQESIIPKKNTTPQICVTKNKKLEISITSAVYSPSMTFTIFSIQGKKIDINQNVQHSIINKGMICVIVDLNSIPSGVYFVHLRNNTKDQTILSQKISF